MGGISVLLDVRPNTKSLEKYAVAEGALAKVSVLTSSQACTRVGGVGGSW